MLKKMLVPAALCGTIAAGVLEEALPSSPASAGSAGVVVNTAVAKAASKSSTTAKAVAAARAFKASLSTEQQATLQTTFNDSTKTTGWSNLPTTLVPRGGVKVGDLTADQIGKLYKLLQASLSAQGFRDEQATRLADTYLNSQQQGGQGGAQQLSYGEGLYYVKFYGTPSTSSKWTLQFGGHHLAIHMTFAGNKIANTPYFVGVEPRTSFTVNGKTYQPMKDEAAALFGAVQALDDSQKAKAKLSQSFDDVLVGPQKDGQFPTQAGIAVSSLSKAQQKLVTKAIWTYVGDMPTKPAKALLATYVKQYKHTTLAYSGTPDGTTTGGYVRLQGPRLWIEIATQNGVVLSGTHYHSIERDQKTDYGAGI